MDDIKNEQVTVTFGGYDDTPDSTIMLEGPLKIWKTVDDIQNLYLLDISGFTTGDSVIVFVKNVNKPNEINLKGSIPYRGSFYQYDWSKNGWQQIVLGNHSHANIEILDQIGNIDTENMPVGTKKVITLEKIDPDTDNNVYTTDYKVSFEDQKNLPDTPVDTYGKKLYLTTDKEGNYKWENNFAPAQTFKLIKFLINSDFILPEDENSINFKKIILSKEYLNKNDVLFEKELNDDLLLFDNGELIPNIRICYNQNQDLILSIENDDLTESQMFELGEKITILIIRNGISGILDTIENQYMTKKDAIDLLSNGTINLNQYTTKKDLKDYAAKINHIHSQYIRKDQYDVFDFRYADYQHTHSQYVTAEQVLGIIYDIAGETGEINPDYLLTQIKEKIDKKLEEFDNKFYSKAQIEKFINAAKDEMSNTDAITVTFDGRTLTEYLKFLEDNQIEIANIDDNKVLLNSVKVNIGKDKNIGGYSSGDVISKGTTLDKFIKKLVQKEIPPELKEPEFNCDFLLSSDEAGDTALLSITPHFVQNDAGILRSIRLEINTTPNNINNKYEYLLNNNETFTSEINLIPYKADGTSVILNIYAEYEQGTEHNNNLNNGKKYFIPRGYKEIEKIIYSKRKCYLGYLPFFAKAEDLTGDTIHNHCFSSKINTLFLYDLNDESYLNEKEVCLNGNIGVKTVLFAVPHFLNAEIKKILFVNQCFDMLDDFSIKTIDVPDASGFVNPIIDNKYDIYYYTLSQESKSDLIFKLSFQKNRKDTL